MKTTLFSILALEAATTMALPKASPMEVVPRAPLNFGRCSDPSIIFGTGFDGRTEAAFQPQDKNQFNHGSAQNIGVIAGFICDRFRDSCGASTDAQNACTSAIEAIAAEIGQAAADAWNNALGVGAGKGKGVTATGVSSVVGAATSAASAPTAPFTNTTQTTSDSAGNAEPTSVDSGAGGAAGSGAGSGTGTGAGTGGAAGSGAGKGGNGGKGGKGKGKGGGKGGNKGGNGASASGSGAASSATGASSARPPAASGTTGGTGAGAGAGAGGAGGNSTSSLCLNPDNVQLASQSDGQANATKGQSPSATDPANFINFCEGQTLTNGLQVKSGSCNGVVMGKIPSTANMIASIITFPGPGSTSNIAADTDFDITVQVQNLVAGSFTNPDNTYYDAPQDLQGGKVVGHTHVTVQSLGKDIKALTPPDPQTFAFFKGINDKGDGNGGLSASVKGGLPAGAYRVCTMTSSSNHQPVLMPVAQRGAQDDCQKFVVQ